MDEPRDEALEFGLMLKHLYRGLVVGTVLLASYGCSGGSSGDDDDNASTANADAVAKCNTFIEVYCPAMLDCLVSGGTIMAADRDAASDACVSSATMGATCSTAVGVSSTYDACITDLHNLDCAAVNAAYNSNTLSSVLPADCHGVILVPG